MPAGARLFLLLGSLFGWLMTAGIVLFSGSLYVLAVSGQKWLGAVAPIGGTALILAWAALAWSVFRAP